MRLKSLNQTIKHRRRLRAAKIEAELKFNEVLLHVLGRDTTMRAFHGALEVRPEAFNGVGMSLATDILLNPVADSHVAIAHLSQFPIAEPLIGVDERALFDRLFDEWQGGFVFDVRE